MAKVARNHSFGGKWLKNGELGAILEAKSLKNRRGGLKIFWVVLCKPLEINVIFFRR